MTDNTASCSPRGLWIGCAKGGSNDIGTIANRSVGGRRSNHSIALDRTDVWSSSQVPEVLAQDVGSFLGPVGIIPCWHGLPRAGGR